MSSNDTLLSVAMRHRQGLLTLDVCFTLTTPWTVLFGPSGSGKTTVLRTIQGFVRPDAGRIVLGGDRVPGGPDRMLNGPERVLTDRATRVWMQPYQRDVRSAAQTARLFPGRTVWENVAFGAAPGVVEEVLSLLRIEGLAGKMPDALSGGERQRVSVARAVASAATAGTLLLLDEPFAGMDLALRDVLAIELRDWLRARGVTVLSVTHDVGEAFLLGAEVIRLMEGRVVEQGPVETVLAVERERLLSQLRG